MSMSMEHFQYSLCRVVLMVTWLNSHVPMEATLSVLALSSRFDGPIFSIFYSVPEELSVLALSSRFDGLKTRPQYRTEELFQYSLCRVVLMVT